MKNKVIKMKIFSCEEIYYAKFEKKLAPPAQKIEPLLKLRKTKGNSRKRI